MVMPIGLTITARIRKESGDVVGAVYGEPLCVEWGVKGIFLDPSTGQNCKGKEMKHYPNARPLSAQQRVG